MGGRSLESVGPDYTGLFCGSEGLFGIALEITLRLLPKPEMFHTVLVGYDSLQAAGDAVSAIIDSGLLPGAMEIMDALVDRSGRSRRRLRLSARCGGGADRRTGRPREKRSNQNAVNWKRSSNRPHRSLSASPSTKRTGCRSGKVASRPFRPSVD